MSNVEYIINSKINVPKIIMRLEHENGGDQVDLEIDDVTKLYPVLSRTTLEEYLHAVENKMIEYVSGIVYDNSSREALSRLNVLANIRDSLRVYLYS
jgi:hypothetical protein